MKSLLVTFDYPPDIGGMAEYYAVTVKRAKGAVMVLHLEYKKTPLSWLSYFPELFHRRKKFNRLLVGNILPLGYLALVLKFFCGISYNVYAHGKDVLSRLSFWKRFWTRVILSNAGELRSNSEYVRGSIANRYGIPRGKIIVEYPRVSSSALEKDSLSSPLIPKDAPFVLLSVGRLVKRKGFDMVIRAISRLPRISYWIIGEGDDEMRLREIAKTCNIENAVRFFGSISRPAIFGYYKSCDAFIMPSRDIDGDVEGFGIVFLEAAVFKKPAIGGRSGGIPEAVDEGRTGFLVDPLDPKHIARAIETCMKNPFLARKMGENGYERVKQKFDY